MNCATNATTDMRVSIQLANLKGGKKDGEEGQA